MFHKIRSRLLFSYLIVLASVLVIFATAVRLVFTRSLKRQLIEELTALAQSAAANAELEQGSFLINDDFLAKDLKASNQGLQWFDSRGKLVAQQGKIALNLPLIQKNNVQIQSGAIPIEGVTLPIISSDDKHLIGYVRASESLEEVEKNLQRLDWGLGSGIFVALALSGVGGVWLTRKAMQPIERSFQQLKQFTADASHELRSPLMAIKSNAAVALKYSEGMRDSDVEKFQAIASATNQMTRLTEDLLLLARTDKVTSYEWVSLNLAVILDDLVQLYQPQAEAKQIHLYIDAKNRGYTEHLYIRGNSILLRRLFTNLIENGLHYTPEGGRVEIKTIREGSHLYISVQDTGVGIAPEHIEQVFERFWRAEQSRSYWNGGTGLGLAIAQAIAQNHGGLITVTSSLGVGSCFRVLLPTSLRSN